MQSPLTIAKNKSLGGVGQLACLTDQYPLNTVDWHPTARISRGLEGCFDTANIGLLLWTRLEISESTRGSLGRPRGRDCCKMSLQLLLRAMMTVLLRDSAL